MLLTANNDENLITENSWGKKIQEIISETGLSVRAFAKAAGYNHPSTFYAAIKTRKPSPKLKLKMREVYREYTGNYLNIKWFEDASEPKLLTVVNTQNTIYESQIQHKNTCQDCLKKDKKINELTEKYNKLLEDYNDCLREVLELRKASSG